MSSFFDLNSMNQKPKMGPVTLHLGPDQLRTTSFDNLLKALRFRNDTVQD